MISAGDAAPCPRTTTRHSAADFTGRLGQTSLVETSKRVVGFCSRVLMTELNPEQRRETYRRMLRIRRFEQEGTRFYKEGKIPGAYASIASSATRAADNDVSSDGFRTKQLPVAKVGPILLAASTSGKFQPTTPATTPIGRRNS